MRIPGPAPVVVGVNGTSSGLAAARLGAREAAARGQPLRIVHVFSWAGPGYCDDAPDWATARHEAGAIVARAVAAATRSVPGVHVEGLLLDGLPVRELLRQSRSAELVVLGDDDVASSASLPADSVLVQTVARSRCPVVVTRGPRPPSGPLLTAVDGSPSSILALRMAAAEAQRRDVAVEVVHVVGHESAQEAGRRLLEEALAAVPELDGARIRVPVGEAAPILLRASRRARMMIVGPRGTGGGTLLGSVAQQLLRRCACPTVFVHGTTAFVHGSTAFVYGSTAGQQSPAGTVPSAGALMS